MFAEVNFSFYSISTEPSKKKNLEEELQIYSGNLKSTTVEKVTIN